MASLLRPERDMSEMNRQKVVGVTGGRMGGGPRVLLPVYDSILVKCCQRNNLTNPVFLGFDAASSICHSAFPNCNEIH